MAMTFLQPNQVKQDISVIASFDTKGTITPIYLRIDGEKFHVASSVIMHRAAEFVQFKAFIEDNDNLRQVTIIFTFKSGIWSLYKDRYL